MTTNTSINAIYTSSNTANTLVQRDTSGNFNANLANFAGLTASQAIVTDSSKNLASMAYSSIGGSSNIVSRDANGNTFANNFTSATNSVVSAGGTTTLNPNSTRLQILTGTQTQTFKLPNATTLNLGTTFEFNNNSTGVLTVNDNSNTLVATIPSGGYARVLASDISTPAGVWDKHFLIPANGSYGTAGMTITGTLGVTSTVNLSGLTASQAVVTDSSKNLTSLAYTNANTVSTLVQRDSSGNFSAGTITATQITTDTVASKTAATNLSITSNGLTFITNAAGSTTVIQSTGGGNGKFATDEIDANLSHTMLVHCNMQFDSTRAISCGTTIGNTFSIAGYDTTDGLPLKNFCVITANHPTTCAWSGGTDATLTWDNGVIGGTTPANGTFTNLVANTSLTAPGVIGATTVVSGTTQSAAINNAYVSNNASQVVITLPTTAAVGSLIRVVGLGSGGWKIAQNASQLIHVVGSVTTTGTGGSLASTNQYDTITLMCIVANTTWTVTSGSTAGYTIV